MVSRVAAFGSGQRRVLGGWLSEGLRADAASSGLTHRTRRFIGRGEPMWGGLRCACGRPAAKPRCGIGSVVGCRAPWLPGSGALLPGGLQAPTGTVPLGNSAENGGLAAGRLESCPTRQHCRGVCQAGYCALIDPPYVNATSRRAGRRAVTSTPVRTSRLRSRRKYSGVWRASSSSVPTRPSR